MQDIPSMLVHRCPLVAVLTVTAWVHNLLEQARFLVFLMLVISNMSRLVLVEMTLMMMRGRLPGSTRSSASRRVRLRWNSSAASLMAAG